ncbi:MAG: D-glycero-beta-D-manno-heptose-1,7-bisphosphate 7-phosphatase [Candidatus Parabeggiatoa sp. nov. 2]|nr:MAG: D-glycero-beta-D-manno-heptose-1,7-bisphosphate 7-phosphatase [Beggiatoa sp. 4572_84]RKZ59163.1 MAG: D-glycero-beta-D-manno-heptose-1,7-bisphosphate 7-phosphatase [Gammaproteobacteria bacterium]HEC84159.1 D-glycero-beta-D-manno-heptose 1,7-bisphosphate 7-phosphatase [Thioploca sp.]
MQKFVILDRDGVINYDSDKYIKSPDEWEPIPGSLEAIVRLNQAGFRVVVITNQSGIARGLFTLDDLNQIHNKMHKLLSEIGGTIEAIFFCPHGKKENCKCRKPCPGLFHDFADRLGIRLADVPAVGDSLRDLQAAAVSGAQQILVLTGKGRHALDGDMEGLDGVQVYDDLATFVDCFLKKVNSI